ncbi:MAG: cobalt ECF transporter T component CbiQ [Eubacteriaceae bacterium]|jgi:cobalt/nickel transport system permease protein
MDIKQLVFVIPAVILLAMIIAGVARQDHHHHGGFGHKHGEATVSIDQYAFQSRLYALNPIFKVSISLTLLLMCVCMNNLWVSLLIILFTTYVTVVLGGLEFHRYVGLMSIPLAFLIIGSIVILFDFSWIANPEALVVWHLFNFYINITSAAITTTVLLWGKAFGAISAMYMMSLTTPSGELFSVLEKWKLSPLLIDLMNMIYRFIFIMMDTQARMKNSAESRLGYKDFKTSIKSFGSTASNLLVVSFRKANAYYDALESRCYDGRMKFLQDAKSVPLRYSAGAACTVVYLAAVWLITR